MSDASGRPDGEAAHLDQQDASRLAAEHGETDFAGFSTIAGDDAGDEAATATEEAALSEADLGLGGDGDNDDERPRPA
ncbi:hypothetical protein [Microbacterium sp. NPDC096154]|uniref:hypothetical protein n=1 Tax=Microbacterium sp. NPDC096154 TaxID=3155549 RepID=UPI003324CA62